MLEPEGRGTAAAFYLATLFSRDDENLLFMPSDHIFRENIFNSNLFSNLEKIELQKNWILFGIKPHSASTEYGYIKVDLNKKNLEKKISSTLYEVTAFKEKPTLKIAKKYLYNKGYFWNSGMFLSNSKMILRDFKRKSPNLTNSCDLAFKHSKLNDDEDEILFEKNFFQKIFINSIDYEIIENSENLKVILLNSDWSDVGSWDSISKILWTQIGNISNDCFLEFHL